jgi:hypothetical protein
MKNEDDARRADEQEERMEGNGGQKSVKVHMKPVKPALA